MIKNIYATLLFILLCGAAAAQQQTAVMTGRVTTTDGIPAEDITVTIKGTPLRTMTNEAGRFSMKVPVGNHTLEVYSIRAHKREYPVTIVAGAENDFPTLKTVEASNELSEVVVTGTRTEKRLADTPVKTTVVTAGEIRKSGSTSLLESLQDNIPGLAITQNAMGNNMRIKGLNSRYVLFLVDGERMVSEGAGGNINFDQIDICNIKRIEVVDGASTALYGSNAMAAVINIITKEPQHEIEVGAYQSYESHNTLRSKIDVGGRRNGYSVRAGGFRNSSDGFSRDVPAEGGNAAYKVYSARYEDMGGDVKFGYKPSGRFDVNLTGRYFRHETFNPAGAISVKHPLTHNLSVGANSGLRSRDERNTLRISAHFNKYFDYDFLERKNSSKLNNSASQLSARVVDTYRRSEKLELVGGAEYNFEENYATTTLGADATTKSINDANLFAQAQYTPVKAFDIVGGARFTHNSQFGSSFDPKLSLMYALDNFKFRGGIGTAFRAPSIKELYYDFDHQGMFWIYGNPDLKAEHGLYSSLSVEYTKGCVNASLSGYNNRISDKITQYSVIDNQGGNNMYYKNVNSATLRGGEASVAVTMVKQIVLRSTYVYCDARDNATDLQITNNVRHSGTASITWNGSVAESPFSIQFAGRVSSPILNQYQETDAAGAVVNVYDKSKSYSIWKVVVVKPVSFGKHVLELTLKADNIFDFKDSQFTNPGRQYMVGLRYNFRSSHIKN